MERALQSPNIIAAIPVAGAATIGDASGTLAIATERGGAGTARGYLVEARSGRETAQVQMLGIPDVPLAAVELGAGSGCLPPGWLVPRPVAATGKSAEPAATPAAYRA